jgi:hypothetical protein
VTNVAVQPCGDSVAQSHFVDTITNTVPLSTILAELSPTDKERVAKSCGSQVAVWGVTPGKKNQNRTKWSRLQPGDVVLLYRQKKLFFRSRILDLVHSRALAAKLWGYTKDGETWEYIYFLDELHSIDISIDEYNGALGYEPANIIQGFQVHSGDQADRLLAQLEIEDVGLLTDATTPKATEDDIRRKLEALTHTDVPVTGRARTEARLFRQHLFAQKTSDVCEICGRSLPVSSLVAAHIKKRANCSPQERLDLNVVMRACRFGCDELFERGYVIVDNEGAIREGDALVQSNDDTRKIAMPLLGTNCLAFREDTRGYFQYHREHQVKKYKK